MPLILLLIALPFFVILFEFIAYLATGRSKVKPIILRVTEIASFLILPFLYVSMDTRNDCCSDSAVFSPPHSLTIFVYVVLCLAAYFYSSYRKKMAAPILEIIVNSLLVLGIVLNIFIAFQTKGYILAIFGNLPIILFALLMLVKNQKLFLADAKDFIPKNKFQSACWKLLNLQPLLKFPLLFIICLPIVIIITALLLLFGQKHDSVIRAFTETYKHRFSQWDYKCDNVECGGHYLCSVAANGHKKLVKPHRFGVRNGGRIICNRQLLVSNAFEELIQEKLPFTHKFIRTQYNKVGNLIHRYCNVFNNKFVSDMVYVIMKPLEWFFLLTLYIVDKKPENRIAQQYLSVEDREDLKKCMENKIN